MKALVAPAALDRADKAVDKTLAEDLTRDAGKTLGRDAWKPSAAVAERELESARALKFGPPPRPEDFATITGTVSELLPDTSPPGGLPHQHFWFQEDGGLRLRVDNDTKFGTEVPGLAPNQRLTIKGIRYHDDPSNGYPARDGIHWTHHKDVPNDAGFIQTPDGKIYQ